jgi:hypothetical protein
MFRHNWTIKYKYREAQVTAAHLIILWDTTELFRVTRAYESSSNLNAYLGWSTSRWKRSRFQSNRDIPSVISVLWARQILWQRLKLGQAFSYHKPFPFPTALSIKIVQCQLLIARRSAFWDTAPFSSLKVRRCFGWICRLHLQVRKIRREETCLKAGEK